MGFLNAAGSLPSLPNAPLLQQPTTGGGSRRYHPSPTQSESTSGVAAFYYYVDYQQYAKPPEDAGRFHAQYRQEYPCAAGQNYLFLEAQGRGAARSTP